MLVYWSKNYGIIPILNRKDLKVKVLMKFHLSRVSVTGICDESL